MMWDAKCEDEDNSMLSWVRPDDGPFVEKRAGLTAVARGIGDVGD